MLLGSNTSLEIYKILLNIQASMPQEIFTTQQDSIFFEDVLGRTKYLPYEYFCHWDVSHQKILRF